jgi:hypothetical protein
MPKKKQVKTVVKTLAEVANHVGVSVATVRNRYAPCGLPVNADGSYTIEDIQKWMTAEKKGPAFDPTRRKLEKDKNTASTDRSKLEIEKLQTEILKLKREAEIKAEDLEKKNRQNELEKGGIGHLSDINRFVTGFLVEARLLLNRLVVETSAGYGQELRKPLREDLEGRCDAILRQLHDWIERIEDLEIRE